MKTALSVIGSLLLITYLVSFGYAAEKQSDMPKVRIETSLGNIVVALNAAAAIGDDRLQKQAQGYVVPESFTHGSSAQRVRWFKQGITTGDVGDCDTFGD